MKKKINEIFGKRIGKYVNLLATIWIFGFFFSIVLIIICVLYQLID